MHLFYTRLFFIYISVYIINCFVLIMHVSGTQLSINDRLQYLYHNSIYFDTFLILFYLFCGLFYLYH
mgnify:CR=1 FL=1